MAGRAERGEPLQIAAADWNAVRDLAGRNREFGQTGAGTPGKTGEPALVVWASRGEGLDDLDSFAPVVLRFADGADPGPLDPAASPHSYRWRPVVAAISPADGGDGSAGEEFGVTLEPIRAGGVGRVIVAGVVACDVDVLDLAHGYARLGTSATHLDSGEAGSARILWRATDETGLQRCLVRLGAGSAAGGVEHLWYCERVKPPFEPGQYVNWDNTANGWTPHTAVLVAEKDAGGSAGISVGGTLATLDLPLGPEGQDYEVEFSVQCVADVLQGTTILRGTGPVTSQSASVRVKSFLYADSVLGADDAATVVEYDQAATWLTAGPAPGATHLDDPVGTWIAVAKGAWVGGGTFRIVVPARVVDSAFGGVALPSQTVRAAVVCTASVEDVDPDATEPYPAFTFKLHVDSWHLRARRVTRETACGPLPAPTVDHDDYQHDPRRAFDHGLTDEPFATVNVTEPGIDDGDLTYKVASSNPSLVTAEPSSDTAVSNPCAVTLTTAASGSGTATITVTGTDPDGRTGTLAYVVRVPADGDPPAPAVKLNYLTSDTSDTVTINQGRPVKCWLVQVTDPNDQAVSLVLKEVTGTHADLIDVELTAVGANRWDVRVAAGGVPSTDYTVTVTLEAENADGYAATLDLTVNAEWPF